jgi:hypothetical protein
MNETLSARAAEEIFGDGGDGGAAIAPVAASARIGTLDFIRGLAVMGILAANIVAFGQPMEAYMYPAAFKVDAGDPGGWMWIAQFILIDGKMRGLFTLLFGAGLYLFMEKAWARGATRWFQVWRLAILMVSANAHEYAAGADGRAAHDGFVLKPFDLDVLLDAIAAQLDLAWADPASAVATILPPLDLAGAAPHLAELRRLGQAGHVRGLEARLQQLAADVPASLPLVAELRDQLRRYDLKAFRERLDACP